MVGENVWACIENPEGDQVESVCGRLRVCVCVRDGRVHEEAAGHRVLHKEVRTHRVSRSRVVEHVTS